MTVAAASQFLPDCTSRFEANLTRIDALSSLPGLETNRRPDAGSWSVAQCLEHAIKTTELYLPHMRTALRRGRDRNLRGESVLGRGTFFGRMLIGALDPARGKPLRLRAPAAFRPSESLIDWSRLLGRARGSHRALIAIAMHADGLDLDRLRHRTPASALLRVSLAQALHLQAIHVARHLDQAERVIGRLSR